MADVQDGDRGKQEAVRDRAQQVEEIRVGDRPDGDDEEVPDARDGAPERGLAGRGYFVGVDDGAGFF